MSLLANAPRLHAHVTRSYDDTDADRSKVFNKSISNLRCEPLLDLEAAREGIGKTRELREPNDFAIRNVGDRCGPEDVRKMVLALRVDGNVFDNDHFAVAICTILEGFEELLDIHAVPAGPVLPRFGHTLWRVFQPLPRGAVTFDCVQKPSRCLANVCEVFAVEARLVFLFRHLKSPVENCTVACVLHALSRDDMEAIHTQPGDRLLAIHFLDPHVRE
jgi:hypothetical protein